MYIYKNPNWANFTWDKDIILNLLSRVKLKQGYLLGKMDTLGFDIKEKAILNILTEDVIKSSEIEGQILNTEQVRSSIAKRLGIDIGSNIFVERDVEGIVEMMLDATQNYSQTITKDRLCGWQSSMFPGSYSGLYKVKTGCYRDDKNGPMQVVSGAIGKEKVHFQAPAAVVLDVEMNKLIDYINNENDNTDLIIKSGIVHLWFVILHPFEDGNGRIARALTDMLLARSENSSNRFYSMSSQIKKVKKSYYKSLEITQKSSLDITDWLQWFLENLLIAIDNSEILLKFVLQKAEFWQKNQSSSLNERQIKVLNMALDDFKGNLTTTKWAKICKCSQDTATRDIADLIGKGILIKQGEARATQYIINF
ncbi:MAG: Fic family protein [Candidatus Gastranaerophilales bacterium]|nr:Fic family protein [Candidatus Gastranaerophilales bacterium]